MSTSKKHYKEIAKINGTLATPDHKSMPRRTPSVLIHFTLNASDLTNALTKLFTEDNPRFDADRFREAVRGACGLRPLTKSPDSH